MFLRYLVTWPSVDIQVKFYEDRPRETPPSGELIRRGVAEYSDFWPIDGLLVINSNVPPIPSLLGGQYRNTLPLFCPPKPPILG